MARPSSAGSGATQARVRRPHNGGSSWKVVYRGPRVYRLFTKYLPSVYRAILENTGGLSEWAPNARSQTSPRPRQRPQSSPEECRLKRFAAAIALVLVLAAFPLATVVYPASTAAPKVVFNGDQRLVNPSQPSVFGAQELEPGIKVDSSGDIYVNAIRGVPAGADLWKTTTPFCQDARNGECPFFYMGQPDTVSPLNGTSVAYGGGDVDMAVGAPYKTSCNQTAGACTAPGSTSGNLYIASLTLANNTNVTCRDGNLSASSCTTPSPVSNPSTSEDRQWVAAEGAHTAYMSYHTVPSDTINVCKSTNDGASYHTCTEAITDALPAAAANYELGNLVVDNGAPVKPTPSTCAAAPCHYIYQIFASVNGAAENAAACPLHTIYVAVSDDGGVTWHDNMVYNAPVKITGTAPTQTCTGPSFNYIFPSVAVDNAGNVYAEWTDGKNVYFESSRDHGTTWNGVKGSCATPCTAYPATAGTGIPTRVSTPYGTANCYTKIASTCGLHTAVFPWVAATGDGHVDFVWYGSSTNKFDGSSSSFGAANSAWSVFFAETLNGLAYATKAHPTAGPTIYQTIASHLPNHVGTICTGGIGCSSGRTLGDFFQVAIEPGTSCAVIAYANDRNSKLPTQAYFNRQLTGCTSLSTARHS